MRGAQFFSEAFDIDDWGVALFPERSLGAGYVF